jgi:hypothetical protein
MSKLEKIAKFLVQSSQAHKDLQNHCFRYPKERWGMYNQPLEFPEIAQSEQKLSNLTPMPQRC